MKPFSLFLTALVISLASASLPACASEQNSRLEGDDLPFSPCIKERRVGALPDSYILEKWPLTEPVKRFYHFLDEWRKLPKPQGYTMEEVRRDMRDTLMDEQCMLALKGLYGALDPGSFAFHSFLATGKRELGQYPREPDLYYKALRSVAEEKFGRSPLFMLAFADGIYEIEIADIAKNPFDRGSEARSSPRYDTVLCIVGNVLDTIKGAWLLGSCSSGKPDTNRNTRKCLLLTVRTRMGTVKAERSIFGHPYKSFYGDMHHPKPGDRYLVFVNMHMIPSDGTENDRYDIFPMNDMQYEGGLFKIHDGKVQDSSNYFGLGTSVEIAALKTHLRRIIKEQLKP